MFPFFPTAPLFRHFLPQNTPEEVSGGRYHTLSEAGLAFMQRTPGDTFLRIALVVLNASDHRPKFICQKALADGNWLCGSSQEEAETEIARVECRFLCSLALHAAIPTENALRNKL